MQTRSGSRQRVMCAWECGGSKQAVGSGTTERLTVHSHEKNACLAQSVDC